MSKKNITFLSNFFSFFSLLKTNIFLLVIFLLYSVFGFIYSGVVCASDIKIISRSEWWALETRRYKDYDFWKNYFTNLESWNVVEETAAEKYQREKTKSINDFLSTNYKSDNTLASTVSTENWHELVWPIQKTNYVKAIVVHHTDTAPWISSYDAIKSIYKYHTLSRWWWDIGYNYLIWFNWEIFEWRAWWDYVVWAQAIRNNRSTVGVALIWQYGSEKITDKQYEALKQLVIYLSEKYWIDLNNLYDYHKDCVWDNCKSYLENYKDDTLVWHRDVGNTSCPWNALYVQLQALKSELKIKTWWFTYVKNKNTSNVKTALDIKLDKLSEYNLLKTLALLDYKIDKSTPWEYKNSMIYKNLRTMVLLKIKSKKQESSKIVTLWYDKNNKISIKLSYPDENNIKIKKWNREYDIKVSSWKLLINDSLLQDTITVTSNSESYLEISSWDRIPAWDKEQKYNDNKFRWDIILSVKDNKLLVVNKLYLSDYLKWLWEVSDSDNSEKIKTIVVAARTYARWYMTKAMKFPWESYQWSDNPDEFQRYLWYSLEQRSPKINKIVNETEDQIITYNDDIIKPWYFTQSSWKTLSYKDYCKDNSDCKKVNYPYLSSVFDPGSVWKTKLGHWVGISWAWATFLASKWWTEDMIIKYFLKGVEVKKI